MSQLQTFNFSAPSQNVWSTQQPGSYYETVNHNGQSFSFQAADVPKRKLEPLFGPLKDTQHVRSVNVSNQNFSNPKSFQSEMRLSTFGITSNSPFRQAPVVYNSASSKARKLSPFLISNQYSSQNGRYFDYSPNTRQVKKNKSIILANLLICCLKKNTLAEAESANNSAQKQSQGAEGGQYQQFTYHERSMNNQQSQLNKLNESPFQSMVISKSNIGHSFSAQERVTPQTKSSISSSIRQDFHSPEQSSSKSSRQLPTSLTNSKNEAQISCLSDSVQQKDRQNVNNHYYPQISQRKSRQLETQSEKSNSSKSKGSYADEAFRNKQPLFESSRNDQTNQNYSQPYEHRQSTEPSFHSPSRAYHHNLHQSNQNQTKFAPQKSNQISPQSDFAYSDTQRIINKWNAKQRHQSELIYNNPNQQFINQEDLIGSVRKNKYLESNLNYSGTGQQFQHDRFGSEKSIKSNELLSQSPQYQYQSPQTAWNHEEPTGMDDNNTQILHQQFQGQQSTNNLEFPQLHPDSRYHHQQKEIDSFSDQNKYQNEGYQFSHRDNGRISNNTSNMSKLQDYQSQELEDEHSQNNLLKDQCIEDNYANNNENEDDQNQKKCQKQNINEKCEDQGNFEDNYQQYQQILESEKLLSQQQNVNKQSYQNEVFQSLPHCADISPDQNTSDLKEMSIKSILNLPNTLKQLKTQREPKKQQKNQTTLVVQVAGIILLLSFLYVLFIR